MATTNAAVKVFPPRDQLTATAWAVFAVLSALREKSRGVLEARTAFNRTCDETPAYLTWQSVALRFPTPRWRVRVALARADAERDRC